MLTKLTVYEQLIYYGVLKSLDERITEDRDKRVVDTAVIKTDDPKSNDDQDERE